MLFKDILAQLNSPADLGESAALLNAVDGLALDRLQAAAEQLLNEVRPDLALNLIAAWEQDYDLHPAPGATLSERRRKLLARVASMGGLSRAYFISVAAQLDQVITIEEYKVSRCGSMKCGDKLTVANVNWMWTVRGLTTQGSFARCGEFLCGQRLTRPAMSIEDIFKDLKPAHTQVNFVYNV